MGSDNPTYLAAVAGQGANAGMVNQFLGSHSAQFVYAGGTTQSQGASGAGVYQSTAVSWYSQLIATTADQTAIGSVNLQISTIGGSPINQTIPPLTVSLYANSAGLPTGSPLVSNSISSTLVYSSPFWLNVPLPISSLTPNTFYLIVVEMVGSGSTYYVWQESTAGVGAGTSPDGIAWTNQSYGLMYQVLDQSGTGQLQYIYEDGGLRWSQVSYNSQGLLSQITEFTTGQTEAGNLQQTRNLTYTNGFLTGVA